METPAVRRRYQRISIQWVDKTRTGGSKSPERIEQVKYVSLPVLGWVLVRPVPNEPGHFLYQNLFGWSDCTRKEDEIILSK
jgi:hypothetical protein